MLLEADLEIIVKNCEEYHDRFSNSLLVNSLIRECNLVLKRDCGFVDLNPPYEMREWDPHKSLGEDLTVSILSQSQVDSKSIPVTSQRDSTTLSLPTSVEESIFIHS